MTTSQPTGAYPNAVAVGDFNGDGIADLAVTDGDDNTVRILIGKGDGTFRWATTLVENNPQFVAVGDFNGDGIPDLVVSNPWGASPTIFLGNGDGAFKGTSTEPAISGPLALGDFNGDGTSDLAATNNMNNTVATALAHPSSATAKLGAVSVAGLGPHLAAARYPGDENYNSKVSATTPLYAPTTAPVISLAGGTYTSVQMLAITDATPGAIIYYSTDGSAPNSDSNRYVGPIAVSTTETVNAISVASGYAPSTVTSVTYTVHLPATATPTISITPGGNPYVTIVDATHDATIYYTTNGEAPTIGSAIYAAPLQVLTSETITAIAVAPGSSPSATASAWCPVSP